VRKRSPAVPGARQRPRDMSDAASPPYSPTWRVPPKAAYRPRGRSIGHAPPSCRFGRRIFFSRHVPRALTVTASGACGCGAPRRTFPPPPPRFPTMPHTMARHCCLRPPGRFLRARSFPAVFCVALPGFLPHRRRTPFHAAPLFPCMTGPEYRVMIILRGIFAFPCNRQGVFCKLAIVSAVSIACHPQERGAPWTTPPDGPRCGVGVGCGAPASPHRRE